MTQHPDNRPLPGVPLDIPLVPELTETLGYRHDARYVGFYQLEGSDDLSVTDGVNTGSAQTWVFQAYRRHPAVFSLLDGVNLGSLDRDASNMLLIDREGGRAAIAPIIQARAFLKGQWPEQPPLTEEKREEIDRRVEEMISRGWHEVRVDPAEVMKGMEEQRGRIGRMMAWLDLCPDAEERGRG
jgi:hypothetical protein